MLMKKSASFNKHCSSYPKLTFAVVLQRTLKKKKKEFVLKNSYKLQEFTVIKKKLLVRVSHLFATSIYFTANHIAFLWDTVNEV